MSRSSRQRPIIRRRLIGAAVLVFVFFLPLHIHIGFSAKVAQECACLQGTRTHLALVPGIFAWATDVIVHTITVETDVVRACEWFGLQRVRAPPDSLRLNFIQVS